MTGLLDTSAFIAVEVGRPLATDLPDEVTVSVITIGELRLGVLMAQDVDARFRRLGTLQVASALEPIPIDDAVAEAWSGLVARLREQGKRMPLNDSWIAATALSHDLTVVTQDDDFDEVPHLRVMKV